MLETPMNDPLPADSPAEDELQFDQAEYATPTDAAETTCGGCKQPIADQYFALNNLILCPQCREVVERHWYGGSKLGRFFKATTLGTIAAVAGFAIYFGVAKLTGLEIGLVSIIVGLLVGGAVRKGSGGRGGWVYQALAIFLTYTAIVASYTGMHIVPALFAQIQEKQAAKAAGPVPAKAEPAKADIAKQPDAAGEAEKEAEAEVGADKSLWFALAYVVGFLYAFPVLAGFEQPIGLFIIGFALWEAWKINRRVRLVIQGPFALGQEESDPGPAHV
jgi:hypothetical protein